MVSLQRFQSVLGKPYLPPLFFFSGVTYNTCVLTRIDRLRDNLLLLADLTLLGSPDRPDWALGTQEATVDDLPPDAPFFMKWVVQAQPYAPMAIQFLLGDSSALTPSFDTSATFAGTAVFFCVLVGFTGGERIPPQPVIERAGAGESLRPCLFCVLHVFPAGDDRLDECRDLPGRSHGDRADRVVRRAVDLLEDADRTPREAMWAGAPALALIGLLVGFYFMNWIPPVPLSLKFGGMYHRGEALGRSVRTEFREILVRGVNARTT